MATMKDNSKQVARDTYVRQLSYGKLCDLSRILDPPGNLNWKALAELMSEYSSTDIALFENSFLRYGGSATIDLLQDWGTKNRTVGDLVDLFKKMKHCVAANLVLPGSMPSVVNEVPGVTRVNDGNGSSMPVYVPASNQPARSPENGAPLRHHHSVSSGSTSSDDVACVNSMSESATGVGPLPTSPPVSPFQNQQQVAPSFDPAGVPSVIHTDQSLLLFQPPTSPPSGNLQMNVRVIEDRTTQSPQCWPESDTSMAPTCPVQVSDSACFEDVEHRRRILAEAAERRMESLSITGSRGSNASSLQPVNVEYEVVRAATNGFDERPLVGGGKKLGQGSFGSVYYGKLEIRGQMHQVAIKRLLKQDLEQGKQLMIQFGSEVRILTCKEHPNLVVLLGYTVNGSEPCLIYEYMCNGSLLDALACKNERKPLHSEIRVSIAVGCAKALSFLHEQNPPLVHRDVKSANVLLDEAYTAKLSDFGIARFLDSSTNCGTECTSKIQGTNAYLAPEASRGTVSIKMDSFALSVVFLELLTGLKPMDASRESQDLKSHIEDEIEKGDKVRLLDKTAQWEEHIALRLWEVSDELSVDKKNKRKSVSEVLPQLLTLLNVQ
ncbi:interleukin-1 receptor-associated kinase 4-like isoform X2 [Corticium candelabrum]|uniref:interleukin-1 receptor-associated kinase 4-like isoform X2 n=1 Tax=Corticium candelabrum TaxID=121492 RepID=UPI002E26B4F4|nr:interleukin-1 receptor-associated kinase 4-like isoform X2 [Corticium candelabrum]